MERMEDRKYSNKSTETVIEYASQSYWSLDKAFAIYELAVRSLVDAALLPVVWRCIGKEIIFVNRLGPPLGQYGALLLINSKRHDVFEAMVQEMRTWSERQQADFFIGMFQKSERRRFLENLSLDYLFEPKVCVGADGDVLWSPAPQ